MLSSERYLFLVYAVLNLGSTDDAFFDQCLLEETTLRTSLAFVVHISANCIHPVDFEGNKNTMTVKGKIIYEVAMFDLWDVESLGSPIQVCPR